MQENLEEIARYEVARCAIDRRRPVWFPILSTAVRYPRADRQEVEAAVCRAILELEAAGYIATFRVPRFWGAPEPVDRDSLVDALNDSKNLRPRMQSVAKLPRLELTTAGWLALNAGSLGEPKSIEGLPRWFETGRQASPGDPQPGQLLAAVTGIALTGGAFAILDGAIQGGWRALTAFPDYVLLAFTIFGIVLGVAVWSLKGQPRADIEYLHDTPTAISVDRFGDRMF